MSVFLLQWRDRRNTEPSGMSATAFQHGADGGAHGTSSVAATPAASADTATTTSRPSWYYIDRR